MVGLPWWELFWYDRRYSDGTYLGDRGYLLDIQRVPRYGTYQRDSSNRYHLVHIKYLLLGFGNDRIVKPSGKFVQNSLKVGESFDSRFIPNSLSFNSTHTINSIYQQVLTMHTLSTSSKQSKLNMAPNCYQNCYQSVTGWVTPNMYIQLVLIMYALSTTNRYLIMSTFNMLLISIIMSTQIIGDCKPHRGASRSFWGV